MPCPDVAFVCGASLQWHIQIIERGAPFNYEKRKLQREIKLKTIEIGSVTGAFFIDCQFSIFNY
jgi:hypothetical protein